LTPAPESCPECGVLDGLHRVKAIHQTSFRLVGSGWASDGYYRFGAYDEHKKAGRSVDLYDNKADIERVMKGEAVEKEKKRLKREHEVGKRVFGPDAGVSEKRAKKKIREAVDKVKV
jgi:hypothetical protein